MESKPHCATRQPVSGDESDQNRARWHEGQAVEAGLTERVRDRDENEDQRELTDFHAQVEANESQRQIPADKPEVRQDRSKTQPVNEAEHESDDPAPLAHEREEV